MLSLNLLPPDKKQEVSKQIMLISLQYLISWTLIVVCGAGITLLITKLIIQNSFNQAVAQGTLITQEYGVLNQKVHTINQKINFLSDIQNKFVIWSPALSTLTATTPKNIVLSSFFANNIAHNLEISGNARTRDDLLLYKKNLEQSPLLSSVKLPIENLLEAADINFRITAKLSPLID